MTLAPITAGCLVCGGAGTETGADPGEETTGGEVAGGAGWVHPPSVTTAAAAAVIVAAQRRMRPGSGGGIDVAMDLDATLPVCGMCSRHDRRVDATDSALGYCQETITEEEVSAAAVMMTRRT
ncbi:hypothetical protein [Mycolicibacterium sp. S2-37]|uniref:hypothetical protein n=1 Tax=Mycolicibacterium sp. S2-37 TaxID=2810297 RepID=UPI0027DA566B|nr:hypothetical protein [Mycolicibacterium sp. S2-37]